VLILGLNAWHADAAACIVLDGKILAAAEEERFVRRKHVAGFPCHAVRYCLEAAGAVPADVDAVAINSDPRANRWRRLAFAAAHPSPALLRERWAVRRRRRELGAELARCSEGVPWRARVVRVEHHRAHLASAFYCSPFDTAAVLSVDGFGDFASTAAGAGLGDRLRIGERVLFPHSLGIFYQALTQYLGFHDYGDEYKVMGLAAYGEPRVEGLSRVLRTRDGGRFALDLDFFGHHRTALGVATAAGEPVFPVLHRAPLERLLGAARAPGDPIEQRHRDVACSVQRRFEEVLFHLLRALHERTGQRRLALAGGCAMNSVANGRICEHTPFEQVFVQPAAGDAGGAMGAALCAQRDLTGRLERRVLESAALGPAFDDAQVACLLSAHRRELEAARCRIAVVEDEQRLCEDTAAAIAHGEVVGWFQGRMEWGARALGQRSILADPRRADMREVLNRKIKRRESFRPFAPSVLREAVGAWFEVDDDVPFMMKVYRIRAARRPMIPAVTHVDGSGRLQTVSASAQPLYHRLIAAFARRTGVPMLLNTSFNENEPIVCAPQDAIACFLRTGMDRLVIGRRVVVREASDDVPATAFRGGVGER